MISASVNLWFLFSGLPFEFRFVAFIDAKLPTAVSFIFYSLADPFSSEFPYLGTHHLRWGRLDCDFAVVVFCFRWIGSWCLLMHFWCLLMHFWWDRWSVRESVMKFDYLLGLHILNGRSWQEQDTVSERLFIRFHSIVSPTFSGFYCSPWWSLQGSMNAGDSAYYFLSLLFIKISNFLLSKVEPWVLRLKSLYYSTRPRWWWELGSA